MPNCASIFRRFLAALALLPELEASSNYWTPISRRTLHASQTNSPCQTCGTCAPHKTTIDVLKAGLPPHRYYWRRMWRILPPYYGVLALVHGVLLPAGRQLQVPPEARYNLCSQP